MTFNQIYTQIQESINSNHLWTKKELDLIFKRSADELELGIYKQQLIEAAAKIIVKLLKKEAKRLTTNQATKGEE